MRNITYVKSFCHIYFTRKKSLLTPELRFLKCLRLVKNRARGHSVPEIPVMIRLAFKYLVLPQSKEHHLKLPCKS